MYKEASKLKLRFNTEKGILTVEQLWDCTRAMLARTIKEYHKIIGKQVGEGDELDFLTEEATTVDPELKLSFDILKDVFLTKKKEAEQARDEEETKQHNAKIDAIIASKQEEQLAGKSIEELEKLRK